jgi:hypothetical protein
LHLAVAIAKQLLKDATAAAERAKVEAERLQDQAISCLRAVVTDFPSATTAADAQKLLDEID